MKVKEIEVGRFYHDNKAGVREVLAITKEADGSPAVKFRIVAAKAAQEYDSERREMVSVLGTTSRCLLSSFATWAKVGMDEQGAKAIMTTMQAKKLKLAPGELAFMVSAIDEVGGHLTESMRIDIAHTEGRAASGLEKKGLLVRDKGTGEAVITPLGAAWSVIYQSK